MDQLVVEFDVAHGGAQVGRQQGGQDELGRARGRLWSDDEVDSDCDAADQQ